MQVYFMRHGQTNYNCLSLCNDDPTRDAHLTEKGRLQAQQAAEQLKHASIERIITSELPRTQQTAVIINQYHQAPMESHPGINDIRSGFEGRPVTEYQKAIAQAPLTSRINNGESLLDHKTRVLNFIHWLKKQPDNCLLVVAHEETLRVINAYFKQLSDREMMQPTFRNCEILQFTL